MKYQGAAEGYAEERVRGLNEMSDKMQEFARNEVWQETISVLGGVKAAFENDVIDPLKQLPAKLGDGLAISLVNMVADLKGAVEAGVQAKRSQKLADVTRAAAEGIAGKLTAGQMEDVLAQMKSGKINHDSLPQEHWDRMIA